MLGTYAMFFCVAVLGLPFIVGVAVAAALLFLVGVLIERGLIEPLRRRAGRDWLIDSFVLTIGLMVILQNLALLTFGSTRRGVATLLPGSFEIGPAIITYERLMILVLAAVFVLALGAFVKFTSLGKAIRATAQNPEAAQTLGIDTPRIYTISFGIGAALAGAARCTPDLDLPGVPHRRLPALAQGLRGGDPGRPRQRHRAPSPAGCCSAWSRPTPSSSSPPAGRTCSPRSSSSWSCCSARRVSSPARASARDRLVAQHAGAGAEGGVPARPPGPGPALGREPLRHHDLHLGPDVRRAGRPLRPDARLRRPHQFRLCRLHRLRRLRLGAGHLPLRGEPLARPRHRRPRRCPCWASSPAC